MRPGALSPAIRACTATSAGAGAGRRLRMAALGAVALGAVALGAAALGGCGASMGAIHEGDIRFERCMALDAEPTVPANVRRSCWAEWVAYYTYGQTRDRVIHAQMRIEQLGGASAFAEPDGESALGAAERGVVRRTSGAVRTGPEEARHGELCASTCAAVRDDCARSCVGANASCRQVCSSGFERCVDSCG